MTIVLSLVIYSQLFIVLVFFLNLLKRKELECETEYDKVCNDKKDGYKGK